MDCARCQDLLLDFLEGVLDQETAAAVEAELRGCEECRAVEARLQNGLALARAMPVVQPPNALQSSLLAAARQHAAQHGLSNGDRVVGEAPAHGSGMFASLAERLGRLLMGPQAAMATIMVLLVAGTAWMVPWLSPKPETFAPAVDVAEEVDPQTNAGGPEESSSRPHDEFGEGAETEQGAGGAPEPAGREQEGDRHGAENEARRSAKRKARAVAKSASDNDALDGMLGSGSASTGDGRQAKGDAAGGSGLRSRSGAPSRSAAGAASHPTKDKAPAPFPAESATDDALAEESSAPAERASPGAKKAEAEADKAVAAPAAPNVAQERALAPAARNEPRPSNLDSGLSYYQDKNYGAAVPLLRAALNEPQTEANRNEARRRLAQSLRLLGNCASALPHYEILLDRGPPTWLADNVDEAAQCYETLGRAEDAKRVRRLLQ